MRTPDEKGAVLLFTVLIVGLAAVGTFAILTRSAFDVVFDGEQQDDTQGVRGDLYVCLDELLLQFNIDSEYSTSTIDTAEAQCSVTITNMGGYVRYADIVLTEGDISRGLHVELTAIPIAVTAVSEQF
jgi:hypothetical protein